MGLFGSTKTKSKLNWIKIVELNQLSELEKESFLRPVIVLKHSTRCSISEMAKNRLEIYWNDIDGIIPFYLDVLSNRDISNHLAEKYGVRHESPQLLLIKNGTCVYTASHHEIDYNQLKSKL